MIERHGQVPAIVFLAVTIIANVASSEPPAVAWADVGDQERRLLMRLLESPHWPDRVMTLLRLERFDGAEVEQLVQRCLGDENRLVRCFAVHAAARMDIDLSPTALVDEADGHVVREALRCGVPVDAERVATGVKRLLGQRSLDELVLGLEIAAVTDDATLRDEATRRLARLMRGLDEPTLIRISRRLARLLRLEREPEGVAAWAAWWRSRDGSLVLPPRAAWIDRERRARPLVADMDDETFFRLMDYLDGLRHRDLDVALVMDATASMRPMVDEARAGVESLVLFLSDLARNGRLAFVAYRDHDNEPVWEGHPFTSDAASIQRFLYDVRITGGADLPEAVLAGLRACGELDWNGRATRQIILVGDAEPHRRDEQQITTLLGRFAEHRIIVHAAHVPMRAAVDVLDRMSPDRRFAYERQIDEHNERTREAFAAIARMGGGRSVTLTDPETLVPSIMHLTIDPAWWPAFDEFYELYLERCR